MNEGAKAPRISHAYIAPPDTAEALAASALCADPQADGSACLTCSDCGKVRARSHPDLTRVTRTEGSSGKLRREIVVSQVREIVAAAPILPNESERRVFLIEEADTMNVSAQNSLLKVLEEPPSFCVFILSSSRPELFLPTIRSRCVIQTRNTEPTAIAGEGSDLSEARQYLNCVLSGNAVSLLRFSASHEGLGSEETRQFLDNLTECVAAKLAASRNPAERSVGLRLLELITDCRNYLRQNVGVKHIWGLLGSRPMRVTPLDNSLPSYVGD